jgi:sulfate transport system substrate-binding protein
VTKIQQAGLIRPGWERENPYNSTPINSTVAVFVRPGNPKKINSWKDLDNKDVEYAFRGRDAPPRDCTLIVHH